MADDSRHSANLGINQVVVVPLGHYERPTAWDRILQDEPLDVVPDKFVPEVEDALFRGNYMVIRQTGMSFSMGTRVEYELCQTCVDGNQPLEGMPERPPWPRNRRERHILAALSRERVVEIAKKVDKDVGVYGQIMLIRLTHHE